MKKILSLLIAAAILCTLTACNLTTNFSDSTGNSKMQAVTQVEELMTALAAADTEKALALMHPDVEEKSENAIEQLSDYLVGRKVTKLDQQNIVVNSSSGNRGKSRQETATFLVTLEDNTVFYISATYLTNNTGKGFISFQFVLGLV